MMTNRPILIINTALLCLLMTGLLGCGGPFVQGELGIPDYDRFGKYIDSLEISLVRNTDTLAVANFPVFIAPGDSSATFEFSKKSLTQRFRPGIDIDENLDKLIMNYERTLAAMVLAFRDSAGRELCDTLPVAVIDFTDWTCDSIFAYYPQFAGRTDINKLILRTEGLTGTTSVHLSDSERKHVDFDLEPQSKNSVPCEENKLKGPVTPD